MTAPIRAFLVDDEPLALKRLARLLEATGRVEIVGRATDPAKGLAQLADEPADVVFLDIQMPGIDGFEVIRRRTPERMPAVVFLTAYDEFALRAFDAQALDYLVKPVSEARFAATMKRLIRQLRVPGPASREQGIVVTTSRSAIVVPIRDIDWIEAAGNYARLWVGDRNYLIRESLGTLESRVRSHGFIRAHRRGLVRLGGVRELTSTADGRSMAVLGCGARIPVSRRRRAAFAAALRSQACGPR
jgi:two-component system LytT family response regulator